MPTRSTYLSADESGRLDRAAAELEIGPSVLIRIAVKHLLGDPLPAWARAAAAVRELADIPAEELKRDRITAET